MMKHLDRGLAGAALAVLAVALLSGALTPQAEAQDGIAATSSGVPAAQATTRPVGRLAPDDFRLVGGWRVAQPFCRGGLAIDFEHKRLFMGGAANRNYVAEFSLSRHAATTGPAEDIPFGKGDDISKWPRLDSVKQHESFWEKGCYAGGLHYENNTLWASPRKFYDTAPPRQFTLSGKDLRTEEIKTRRVELPRAAYGGGFIKGKPNTMLIGCGGYESGQGSAAGPTLATPEGKVLIGQKNHGTMTFEQRELRPPNYWPKARKDGWIALVPRDGVGRWACDRVHGGGIWHPRGVCYWALLGIDELDYARQNETFGASNETWLYAYDAQTYDKVEFNLWKHGHVIGHEVGPDGLVYLLVRNAWKSSMYRVDPVIKVFEIAADR